MEESIIRFARVVITFTVIGVVLAASQGCSTTDVGMGSREAVLADLTSIIEVERQSQVIRQIVGAAGRYGILDDRAVMGIKEHYDLYYIYHMAAAVHLAHGEREQYLEYVGLARRELDAMESIIRLAGQEYYFR